MLFSAPLEVARTKACTVRAELDERVGQVRAHEAVGAGHEHGASLVELGEVARAALRALRSVQIGASLFEFAVEAMSAETRTA